MVVPFIRFVPIPAYVAAFYMNQQPPPLPHIPDSVADPNHCERHRLETFPPYWSLQELYPKSDLAKAGAYWIQEEGHVTCVFCGDTWFIQGGQLVNFGARQGRHGDVTTLCARLQVQEAHPNVPLDTPAIPNYGEEEQRLLSFQLNNWTAPVPPNDLARAGFHFYPGMEEGEEGAVAVTSTTTAQCFFCGMVCSHWLEGQSVEEQHREGSPDCELLQPAAQNNANNSTVNNVPLGP